MARVRPLSRVVTVSSLGHRIGRIDVDNLDAGRSYDKWRAYAQSELADLLFISELQCRRAAHAVRGHPPHGAR